MKTIFVIRPDDVAKYGPGLLSLFVPLVLIVIIAGAIILTGLGVYHGFAWCVPHAKSLFNAFVSSKIWVLGYLTIPASIIYFGYKHEQKKKLKTKRRRRRYQS